MTLISLCITLGNALGDDPQSDDPSAHMRSIIFAVHILFFQHTYAFSRSFSIDLLLLEHERRRLLCSFVSDSWIDHNEYFCECYSRASSRSCEWHWFNLIFLFFLIELVNIYSVHKVIYLFCFWYSFVVPEEKLATGHIMVSTVMGNVLVFFHFNSPFESRSNTEFRITFFFF
jgi:hypothetical protein